MVELASTIWADGPASMPHEPKKSEIRKWGGWIEGLVQLFVTGGGYIYPSRAALNGDLTKVSNSMAWVVGDPVSDNNGVYGKVGASGSGTWTRRADLPFSFIVADDVSGTPNVILATTAIPVSSASFVWLHVADTNTSSPVTVSFNGGPPLIIKTNTGFPLAPGGLRSGMIAAGFISDDSFRLISDNIASSLFSEMEELVSQASTSRDQSADYAQIAIEKADLSTASASNAQSFANQAHDLVEAATAGFSGFMQGQAYDFGFVSDETTYFDQDWGLIVAP